MWYQVTGENKLFVCNLKCFVKAWIIIIDFEETKVFLGNLLVCLIGQRKTLFIPWQNMYIPFLWPTINNKST